MKKLFKLITMYWHMEPDKDGALKQFLQAEYKKDWKAAYLQYKEEGTLPSYMRRRL
tara:strand:+ start:945 stop:1112 length:168 start_codon:yes stop_codon:yes gene_type:complete